MDVLYTNVRAWTFRKRSEASLILTIHLLELFHNLTKRHSVLWDLANESRQDTIGDLEFLLQIVIGPAVVIQFEFGRYAVVQISLSDTQWIQVGNVVTTNYSKLSAQSPSKDPFRLTLVRSHQQLYLQIIGHIPLRFAR